MTDLKARKYDYLIGNRIGTLEILEPWEAYKSIHKGKKSSRARYLALCDCGNLKIVDSGYLRVRKESSTCQGCAYRTRNQSKIRQSVWSRLFKLTIENRTKKGRIKNRLTEKQFKNIVTKDCYYCGTPPKYKNYLRKNKYALSEVVYANGIDRIDSSKDYEKSNCRPCCKQCNIAKNSMTEQEFYKHMLKIVKHLELDNAQNLGTDDRDKVGE